jgi:hypothetical protein
MGKKQKTHLASGFFSPPFLEVFYLWLHKKCNYKFGPQENKNILPVLGGRVLELEKTNPPSVLRAVL